MTLKNKDGSIYKLAAPNPVMKSQETWDKFIVHNMNWQSEKKEDKRPVYTPPETKPRDSFLSELEDSKPEVKPEIKIVETKKENIPLVPETKVDIKETSPAQKTDEINDNSIEKTFIYVLPALIKRRVDDLYGDTYQTIQYGNPTSFEGVILKQEDFVIEIWTDVETITLGSILYPRANFKRWWRVQDKSPKVGGWILTGTPSDHQPSFDF